MTKIQWLYRSDFKNWIWGNYSGGVFPEEEHLVGKTYLNSYDLGKRESSIFEVNPVYATLLLFFSFMKKSFRIKKTFFFEAGHVLPLHDGKCRNPHGHSYRLEVFLQAPDLQESGPKKGMVIDFQEISDIVHPMIRRYFDHHWLNDSLETDCPTAEWIAQWIYHYLKPKLPLLTAVGIWETETSSVLYEETTSV